MEFELVLLFLTISLNYWFMLTLYVEVGHIGETYNPVCFWKPRYSAILRKWRPIPYGTPILFPRNITDSATSFVINKLFWCFKLVFIHTLKHYVTTNSSRRRRDRISEEQAFFIPIQFSNALPNWTCSHAYLLKLRYYHLLKSEYSILVNFTYFYSPLSSAFSIWLIFFL